MADYQGKKVVIIGLGMTGLSLCGLFHGPRRDAARHGYCAAPSGLDKLPEEVERYAGGLNEDWLLAADLIGKPGTALAHLSGGGDGRRRGNRWRHRAVLPRGAGADCGDYRFKR